MPAGALKANSTSGLALASNCEPKLRLPSRVSKRVLKRLAELRAAIVPRESN